jgi:hypothetical protein
VAVAYGGTSEKMIMFGGDNGAALVPNTVYSLDSTTCMIYLNFNGVFGNFVILNP